MVEKLKPTGHDRQTSSNTYRFGIKNSCVMISNIKSHKHDDDHNEHEHNSEHKNPNIHKHELNNQNLEKIIIRIHKNQINSLMKTIFTMMIMTMIIMTMTEKRKNSKKNHQTKYSCF